MIKRFCPKCGKPMDEGGVLCSDCQKTELKYDMPRIQVSEFNRFFDKGRWTHFDDLDDLIVRKVREALKNKSIPIEVPPFEFEPKPKHKVQIEVFATIDNAEVPLPVQIGYMQCDFGQKQKTSYYEGILQLRRPTEEVFAYIERELQKVSKKGVFITKTVETKNGIDLYFTKKDAMRLLAQKLPPKFGGTINMNPQLFSHNKQTSKDIFRLNILVEFPVFEIGHPITYMKNNTSFTALITKMGKIIQGKDLNTGKLVSFELKHISETKVLDLKETTVVQTEPELLVLNPETYQADMVTNASILKGQYENDDNVTVVSSSEGLFIIE